jgi:SAM-dependent methyltransferase
MSDGLGQSSLIAPVSAAVDDTIGKPPGFFAGTGMPDNDWWQALWPDPAGVLTASGLQPGMNAIDLCAGDGWFTLPMAKVAKYVAAIDIDPVLLDQARKRLKDGTATNCDFIHGDAYNIARLTGSADFVFMANAFHGVPDPLRLTKAVRDAMTPGGIFAIVNWHRLPREETIVLGQPRGPATELRMTPDATIQSVKDSGLQLARVIEIPPYHYGLVLHRQ